MNPAIWLCCFLPIIIILLQNEQNKKAAIQKHIISKRKGKDKTAMVELLKGYIGKECLIYTLNSQLSGTVKEVTAGGIVIDNGKDTEIVNIDYIVRVREYPRNKNGKKKSIVSD